jgi:hypothetical protein
VEDCRLDDLIDHPILACMSVLHETYLQYLILEITKVNLTKNMKQMTDDRFHSFLAKLLKYQCSAAIICWHNYVLKMSVFAVFDDYPKNLSISLYINA